MGDTINEVFTFAEAAKILGVYNSGYITVHLNCLIEGIHYRSAGRNKLITKDGIIRLAKIHNKSCDFMAVLEVIK